MKTKIFILMTLVFLIFFGCKEKKEIDLSSSGDDGQGEEQAVESSIRIKATITYHELSLMDAAEDGSWIKALDMGEVVYILSEIPSGKGNWRPVEIELQDSKKTTGFANAWFVIPDSSPAVTITDAKIFSEPKTTKMTEKKIPEMRIVAVTNGSYENNYAEVNYSSPKGFAQRPCYLSSDSFSTNKDDINAARLFMIAKTEKKTEMQVAFLEEAAKIGSPAFGMIIDNALSRVKSGDSIEGENDSVGINDSDTDGTMMEADPDAAMDEGM